MLHDRFGLPLSTSNAAARDAYVAGVDLMLSANAGAEPVLEDALALDPQFSLAHIALARLRQMQARGPEALQSATTARELAAGQSARERGHVEPVALLIEGRGGDAYAAVRAHVADYPRDAVPLSLALGVYGLIGFSGRRDHHREQRDLLETLAPHWDEDWWFLTYLGWSRVETGEPTLGVDLLDRALERNPRNAHGAHSRAHAYYEMGDAAGGMRFIDGWLPDYDPAAQLHCHLAWHRALFALQLGDSDAALTMYDSAIAPDVAQSPPLFTLADTASLLWRLGLYGHGSAEPRRKAVSDLAARAFPHAGVAFADVHACLADAAMDNSTAIEQRIHEDEALVAKGRLLAGAVVPTIGKGIAAFARGDYDEAIDRLRHAAEDLPGIGGSHAQRDVVVDTLIVACLRAGRRDEAEAIVQRRHSHRAGHLDDAWLARVAAAQA